MSFDKNDSRTEPMYLLRLEQGPLAVTGARPSWVVSEAGLTVGRAPDCSISLIDTERLISRVQGRISLVQGNAIWQQLGANPSWVNETAIEKGSQHEVKANDLIRLDPYVFQLTLRIPVGALGAIPDDWNPMTQPVIPAANSIKLTGLEGEVSNELPGIHLERILQHSGGEADFETELPDSTLFTPPSSIDVILGSSSPHANATTSSVWMDELHARHGFSVSAGSTGDSTHESIAELTTELSKLAQPDRKDFESRFLEGLGIDTWMKNKAHAVSPSFAFEMGRAYRKALEGMIELMSARTLLKNQVHAEHTTLVPRDNNPLKFCPNVDDLFLRWFASADGSYLSPVQAMESTIHDLLEQQRATALAMRIVISQLAESFDPDALISKSESSTGAWDVRKYKARWETHKEAYRSVFGHAADPVSALLSDSFRQAFEQCTEQPNKGSHL